MTIGAATPQLQPIVRRLSVSTGPGTGGTTVIISGNHFRNVAAVRFGTVPAAGFTVIGPQKISAVAPAGTGAVDVTVTTPGGTSAITTADKFTYDAPPPPPAPTIISLTPSTSVEGVATEVTIAGTNLAGASVVFGGTPATVVSDSAESLGVQIPLLEYVGPVSVVVTTAGGSASASYTLTPAVPPPPPVPSGPQVSTPTASTGTYTDVVAAGGPELVIQSIKGNPTSYIAWDEYGNVVASGPMPAPVAPELFPDVTKEFNAQGTPAVLTPVNTPEIGDTLLVLVGSGQTNDFGLTIEGGGVTNWAKGDVHGDNFSPSIYYGTVTEVPESWAVTVTATGGQAGYAPWYATLVPVRGLAFQGLVDLVATSESAPTATSVLIPNATPNGDGELLIAVAAAWSSADGQTTGSAFTEFGSIPVGVGYSAAYLVQSEAAPSNPSGVNAFRVSGNGNTGWSVLLAGLVPAVGGTTLSIPAPDGEAWQAGFVYVAFSNAEGFCDSVKVNIVTDPEVLPNPADLPPWGTPFGDLGEDPVLHGWAAMGPIRAGITNALDPTSPNPVNPEAATAYGGTIAGIEADVAVAAAPGGNGYLDPDHQDPAHPHEYLVTFPNDVVTPTNESAYAAGVTEVVKAIGPGTPSDVVVFEGLNEPINNGLSPAQSATQFVTFRKAVKAADAEALAGGPCDVGHALEPWLTDVVAAGQPPDFITMHFYNDYNGDFLVTDAVLASLRSELAAHPGLGALPIWCTEFGGLRLGFDGFLLADPMRLLAWTAAFLVTADRYGVELPNLAFYYDGNHGDPYASWIRSNDCSMDPRPILFREWALAQWEMPYLRPLSFGPVASHFIRGNVYADASSGTLALIAQGMLAEPIVLSGLTPGRSVYVSGWAGNTWPVQADQSGLLSLTVGSLPIYVYLTAAEAAAVAGTSNLEGTNVAPEATVTTLSGSAGANLISDGNYQPGGLYGAACFQSEASPEAITWTWASPVTIKRFVVRQMAPWSDIGGGPGGSGHASAMIAGSLEALVGGTWVAVPTVPGNHWNASGVYSNPTAKSYPTDVGHDGNPPGTSLYSTWDQHWCHDVPFAEAVTTTALRWTVTEGSRGHFPDDVNGLVTDAYVPAGLSVSEALILTE